MTRVAVAIPARMTSSRLPGKPIRPLGGIPLIKRCYDSVIEAGYDTFVLTDSQEIADIIRPGRCFVDTIEYRNGTERIAGWAEKGAFNDYDVVINCQGDQPWVDAEWIHKVARATAKNHLDPHTIVHLYGELDEDEEDDPSVVKMIVSDSVPQQMMWASRSFTYGRRFVGIYGFKKAFLLRHNSLPVKEGELNENIEQLRWIENGYKVKAIPVKVPKGFVDINTQNDVEKWYEYSGKSLGNN